MNKIKDWNQIDSTKYSSLFMKSRSSSYSSMGLSQFLEFVGKDLEFTPSEQKEEQKEELTEEQMFNNVKNVIGKIVNKT